MSDLAVAVCSITVTQRRRFFWAAWWTSEPVAYPFRKPDASNGGATSHEEARARAEKAAGRSLVVIDPRWARAWIRVLRGQSAWASREAATPNVRSAPSSETEDAAAAQKGPRSIWQTLGLREGASILEIKTAFRTRAKIVHPDLGGDAEAFRELKRAYEEAVRRATKDEKRPKRKR